MFTRRMIAFALAATVTFSALAIAQEKKAGDDTGLRGRPRSAIGAMVFTYVGGDEPPTDLSGWRFHALASGTSIDITFDAALAPGRKV